MKSQPIELEGGLANQVEIVIRFVNMPKQVKLGALHKLFSRFGIQGQWTLVGFDISEKTLRFIRK